jgi:hypothetical protein
MSLFPRYEIRQKGWPKWAKRIYNAQCGCRMFCLGNDAPDQDAHPIKFLVHCLKDNAPEHRRDSYTEIKDKVK